MIKRFSTNYVVILFLIDMVLVQIALSLSASLRFILPFGQMLLPEWSSVIVYVPTPLLHLGVFSIWAICLLLGSVYTPRRIVFWIEEFQHVLISHTVAASMLAALLYIAKKELPRLTFIYFFILVLFLLLGYRIVLRSWFRLRRRQGNDVTRILVVGAGQVGRNLVAQFRNPHWSGLEVIGFVDDDPNIQHTSVLNLPVLGSVEAAPSVVKKHLVDEVIIALPLHAHIRQANLIAMLQELPIRLHVVPDYFDLAFHGATVESVGGIPLIGLRDSAIDGFARFSKRLMDIVLSGFGLLVLSPIMAAVSLAIKLEDGGPVFYRAERIGENGRPFHMLKFRSMVVNADALQHLVSEVDDEGNIVFKHSHDPRVTRVGRFIRRTSIDELPQLLNVLKGDMSLVGPRPELPWMVEKYEPWQRKRFAVPQGITGWWQINGRSDNPMYLHTEHDLYYIQHYSLWLDIQILWRTMAVVARGKGAY